jgi:hypothetical protein
MLLRAAVKDISSTTCMTETLMSVLYQWCELQTTMMPAPSLILPLLLLLYGQQHVALNDAGSAINSTCALYTALTASTACELPASAIALSALI